MNSKKMLLLLTKKLTNIEINKTSFNWKNLEYGKLLIQQ